MHPATAPRTTRAAQQAVTARTRLLPVPRLETEADVARFLERDAPDWLTLERDLSGDGLHLPAELLDDLAHVLRAAGAALRGEHVELEDGSAHPQARAVLAAIALSVPVRKRLAGTAGAKRLIAALRGST